MSNATPDVKVRCAKCGDVHMESSRLERDAAEKEKEGFTVMVCPKCGHDTWIKV